MQSVPSILHPVKAVLFDLDGTLVHSSLDFPRIREEIACPEGEDLLHFVSTLSADRKKQAEQIIHRHELEDAYSARIIDGAFELLMRLDDSGIRTGIITRNSAEATRIKMHACGLQVEHVITREDAPPKPDPGALLMLSEAWALETECCVYVGDYIYDLQAAKNAGMHACLYHDTKNASKASPWFIELADFVCNDFDVFEFGLQEYLSAKVFSR